MPQRLASTWGIIYILFCLETNVRRLYNPTHSVKSRVESPLPIFRWETNYKVDILGPMTAGGAMRGERPLRDGVKSNRIRGCKRDGVGA